MFRVTSRLGLRTNRRICQKLLSDASVASAASANAQSVVQNKDYDIIINGGGVVGAALAARLLQLSDGQLRIAMFEQGKIPSLPEEGALPDIRTYALSPKSIKFLDEIGAWKYIEPRSQVYNNMQIWETSGPGVIKFRAEDLSVEELGRICEDRTISAAIYRSIADAGHSIDIINDRKMVSFSLPKDSGNFHFDDIVVVKSNDGQSHRCQLLVGADGAMSMVRQSAGMKSFGWTYGQQAVVGTVKLDVHPTDPSPISTIVRQTAWQKYLKTGPLAVLPLWGGYASIVWSLPTLEATRMRSMTDEEWVNALNSALQAQSEGAASIGHSNPEDDASYSPMPDSLHPAMSLLWAVARKGRKATLDIQKELRAVVDTAVSAAQMNDPVYFPPHITQAMSPRMTFPLQLQQASSYIAPRLALVGDAAHSIHPQAGQGLNLGISDAACLAETIESAMSSGSDFGVESSLRPYHKKRFAANLAMLTAVDTIHRVFSTPETSGSGRIVNFLHNRYVEDAQQVVKSLGMLGLNTVGKSVKNEMAKMAMGLK